MTTCAAQSSWRAALGEWTQGISVRTYKMLKLFGKWRNIPLCNTNLPKLIGCDLDAENIQIVAYKYIRVQTLDLGLNIALGYHFDIPVFRVACSADSVYNTHHHVDASFSVESRLYTQLLIRIWSPSLWCRDWVLAAQMYYTTHPTITINVITEAHPTNQLLGLI